MHSACFDEIARVCFLEATKDLLLERGGDSFRVSCLCDAYCVNDDSSLIDRSL